MRSSLQRRSLGVHRGRAACLRRRVWAVARGVPAVSPGEEQSIVIVQSGFSADCGQWG